MRRTKWIYTVIAVLLCFSGCGEAAAPAAEDPVPEEQLDTEVPGAHPSAASGSLEPYKAPPFLDAQFHGQNAASTGEVVLDTSAVSDGYIAVSAFSPQRLKFQVLKDGTTYNYDIDSGGTPSIFPLQSGDGQYTFRVMENITDSKYAELYAESCQVVLQDSFQPFLRPSDYVSYSQNSSCVKKAAELQYEANKIITFLSKYGNGTGKAFMKAAGMDLGPCRLPLRTLTDAEYESFVADLGQTKFEEYKCGK